MSPLLLGGAVVLLAAACAGGDGPATEVDESNGNATDVAVTRSADAPNIVVVMTDDQWLESMSVMPRTQELIVDAGTRFDDAVVSLPRCCPSRATFLTGQYAHNHGVEGNRPDDVDDPNGGYKALRAEDTIAVRLEAAGYTTAHMGKYLNGYGNPRQQSEPTEIPEGWTEWYGMTDPQTYRYEAPRFNIDGRLVCYGEQRAETACDEEIATGYSTDIIGDFADDFITRHAGAADPFFLVVAPLAPHVEVLDGVVALPVSAPRHRGTLQPLGWAGDLVDGPAFNEQDVSDKATPIADSPALGEEQEFSNGANRLNGLESLLAVDELVAGLMGGLAEAGVLEETVVIFTSDNGLALGDHRQTGKYYPYERSIRVPLAIRGAGFPSGGVVDVPVANVDLAPTILGAAGVEPLFELDGIDLVDLVTDPAAAAADRAVLLESGRTQSTYERFGSWYTGVRTSGYVYLEYESDAGIEYELYDLVADPFQLDSRVDDPAMADVRAELAAELEDLRDCSGATCR